MEGQVQVFGELQEFLRGGADLPVVLSTALFVPLRVCIELLIDVAEAGQLIKSHGYMSAVGHHASAEVLSASYRWMYL